MDESLKSIRTIHQILILVSTAIAVFAISIKPVDDIYKEVSTYISFNQHKFSHLVASTHSNEITNQIKDIKALLGVMPNNVPSLTVQFAYNPGGIPSLNQLVTHEGKFDIKKAMRHFKVPEYSSLIKRIISSANLSNKSWYVQLDTLPNEPDSLRVLIFLETQNSRPIEDRLPEILKLKSKSIIQSGVRAGDAYVQNCYARVMAVNPEDVKSVDFLYPEVDQDFYNNPEILSLIRRIANLSMVKAIDFVETLSDEQLKKGGGDEIGLEIVGLKVASKVAVIIAPVILLFLLLYMLALVLHLNKIFAVDKGTANTFPWMGLFTNRFSQVLTITSLVILPVLSASLIVFKSYSPISTKWQLGVIYLISFTLVSVYATWQIFRFQKVVHHGDIIYDL